MGWITSIVLIFSILPNYSWISLYLEYLELGYLEKSAISNSKTHSPCPCFSVTYLVSAISNCFCFPWVFEIAGFNCNFNHLPWFSELLSLGINLFSLVCLLSNFRPCDVTLYNYFFQIASYVFERIIFTLTKERTSRGLNPFVLRQANLRIHLKVTRLFVANKVATSLSTKIHSYTSYTRPYILSVFRLPYITCVKICLYLKIKSL